MDTEFAAIRQKQRLKRLEQQIEDILTNVDYDKLVKELDYQCMYSTEAKINIVRILCNIRLKEKQKDTRNKKLPKLQKLINHYAIENDDMVVLKP